MVELQRLSELKEWDALLDTLDQERKADFRQILAVQTSQCCALQHQPRMVPSLKDTGLDNRVVIDQNTGAVILSLEAVHDGQKNDALPPVSVVIQGEPTFIEAQEKACKVTLAFLLSAGADQIQLHPNSLAHGQCSVALLREAGHKVSQAAGPPASGTWREWMQQLPAATEIEAGPTRSGGGPKQANTEVVLRALLSHKKHDHIDPSYLPLHLRRTLEENLPKRGLKAFLLKNSDKFEVQEGDGKKWTFSIKTSGHEQPQPPPPPTNVVAPTSGDDDPWPPRWPPPGLGHRVEGSSSTGWRGWNDSESWGDWKGRADSERWSGWRGWGDSEHSEHCGDSKGWASGGWRGSGEQN